MRATFELLRFSGHHIMERGSPEITPKEETVKK
jgi:hypothetical protein